MCFSPLSLACFCSCHWSPGFQIKQQPCKRYYEIQKYSPVGDNYHTFAQCSSLWGDFRIKSIQMQVMVMSPVQAEVWWATSSAQNQSEVKMKVSPPGFSCNPWSSLFWHISHRNPLRFMFKFCHQQKLPWLKQSRNGSLYFTDEKTKMTSRYFKGFINVTKCETVTQILKFLPQTYCFSHNT